MHFLFSISRGQELGTALTLPRPSPCLALTLHLLKHKGLLIPDGIDGVGSGRQLGAIAPLGVPRKAKQLHFHIGAHTAFRQELPRDYLEVGAHGKAVSAPPPSHSPAPCEECHSALATDQRLCGSRLQLSSGDQGVSSIQEGVCLPSPLPGKEGLGLSPRAWLLQPHFAHSSPLPHPSLSPSPWFPWGPRGSLQG